MKVILTSDVPRVGKKYDIKDVPQGYAHNFLFKQGKAILATDDAIRDIEKKKESIRLEREMNASLLRKHLEELRSISLTMKAVANEKGHLFKSIHTKEIVDALLHDKRVSISEKMIDLAEPVKTVGTHTIPVTLDGQKGSFTLVIEAK